MRRINAFIIKVSQDRLSRRIMPNCAHELAMKPLPRKRHRSIRRPTTSTKFYIINVGLGAKLKFHELLMDRPVTNWREFVTVAQKYVLDRSANRKHTRYYRHYTTAFPALPKALIFSSTTTCTAPYTSGMSFTTAYSSGCSRRTFSRVSRNAIRMSLFMLILLTPIFAASSK
ncbi:hypothetical protein D9M68_697200 [compost metagenome]